jgi:porin
MKSFDFSSFFARTLLFFLFFISLLVGQSLEAQALSTNLNDIHSDSNDVAADQDNSIRKFKPWLEEDNATGHWFRLRDRLSQKGIDLGFSYINEVWGNTTGGIKTGSVYTSVFQFATAVNLEKLMNWRGASFYSRWLYLGGQDPSSYLVGDILGVSNIGAYNTFRNIELWLQQSIFEDKI